MSELKKAVKELGDVVSSLREWHQNLPESFQNGEKGEALSSAISALEDLQGSLESAEAECSSVEFPSMY